MNSITKAKIITNKLLFLALLSIILVPLLSSCEDGTHLFIRDDIAEYEDDDISQIRHSVFFYSEPRQLAMYEPRFGTLIGMYTDALPQNDRTIRHIEASTGVNHATFMDVMHLGDPVPFMWILECMAERKVPMIVILPPREEDEQSKAPFGGYWEETIRRTAMAIGNFNLPVFIAFYPVEAGMNWNPSSYIAFFRQARAIFAEHAPQVAFVWLVDSCISAPERFYPGERASDWVGMNLFCQEPESLENALNFYNQFQHVAPIMLNLGIAHFTTEGHRYTISEAAFALNQIYQALLYEFPMVRMVNYMDVNRIPITGQDYRVSLDRDLRIAYYESVQGFLSELPRLESNEIGERIAMPIRSEYFAYVEDGRVYLDARILTEELGKANPRTTRWIGGARRVEAEEAGVSVVFRGGGIWLVNY